MTAKRGKETVKKRSTKKDSKKPAAQSSANGPTAGMPLDVAARPISPLRGILPTPPEVAAAVEDVLAGRPASPSYIQLITDQHKLRYYFGGHWVAYRNTPQGKEVLAVGLEEMSRVRKGMSLAERESVVWASIDLWHNCE